MSKSKRRQRPLARHPERIWSFREFAALNGICTATLTRSIARGEGPPVIKISPRRFGIRESDGAAWQAARVQERA
jgi:predicted DNA-binding transcriptional regulator AlpA